MELRGLLGPNFLTWTLQMIWLSSPIPRDRCKTRLEQLRTIQTTLVYHRSKCKVLLNNIAVSTTSIPLDGDALEYLTSFTYLGSIVDKQGGTDTDHIVKLNVRTGRVRAAFLQIKNSWASPNLTITIKISIFNTTVKLKPVQSPHVNLSRMSLYQNNLNPNSANLQLTTNTASCNR